MSRTSTSLWWWQRYALFFLIGVLVAELSCRWGLGLGTPALSITHPSIEYLFAPDQDLMRFGKRFTTNSWGMRSDSFPSRKLNSNEYRVLVFGDSVVNGGNLTDHEELATTIVQRLLIKKWSQPVIVANISAGSWGPGNWLAFVKEYGVFDADQVVLVMNGGDLSDVPMFDKLNPNTHPVRQPWCATQEFFSRYLPRYLPGLPDFSIQNGKTQSSENASSIANAEAISSENILELIDIFRSKRIPLYVIKYASRSEVDGGYEDQQLAKLSKLFTDKQVQTHSTLPYFDKTQADVLFRDDIHPNPAGQKEIARLLELVIEEARKRRD